MLRVNVLGRMVVERDGAVVTAPSSRRAWSLLGYLAINPGLQPRGELAARFWPDVLDSSARASLRSAIWSLRGALEPHAGLLVTDRDTVGLGREEGLWVDALAFDALLAGGEEEAAVALYAGDLLSGFEEEWVLDARELYRERLLKALECLAARRQAAGELAAAIEWSRRAAAVDPFGEEAHRRLIVRLTESGDRASALLSYRAFCDRLRRELGVAPSAATRELIEELRTDARANGGDRARGRGATAPPARASYASAMPLIARDEELAALRQAWSAALTGSGGVVCVRGEAGIGKTRLASELLHAAARDGAVTASCAALDLGGSAPFGLWAELIRELLPALAPPPPEAAWPEDLAALAPEIHARFGRAPPARSSAAPELERARLLEAVVALLEWAASRSSLALLLEDVHIADTASLELTGYVARRIASLPVLLVLTRRSRPRRAEADQLEHALRSRELLPVELTLGALDAEAIGELALAAAAIEGADVQRVVATADGNALLAVEMARALARGERELSDGLSGAVRGAFGALSPEARAFAELAAVAARELDGSELASLPIEQPAEAAAQALDSGMFVSRERRIGFRHALLREAVYADLPEPARADLHARWAEVLLAGEARGARPRAAEVAQHMRLAGRLQAAVSQLELAAAEARAVAALPEAAGYLREAAEIERADAALLLELAEIEAWRGRREEAEEAFARAWALLRDAPARERAAAHLRRARWYHGPICVPALVLESARAALALLDAAAIVAVEERREALAAFAWAEAVAGSEEVADRLLADLHALTEGRPEGDLSIYDVAHVRAIAAIRRGDFEASYGPSVAAGEAITRAGRPDLAYGCWANAAGAAAAAGDFARALEFLDRCAAVVEGNGLTAIEIQLLAQRSFLLLRTGDHDGATIAADAAVALAARIAQPALVAMAAHDRGLVALATGDFDRAAGLLGEALVEGAPVSAAMTRLARAEALARADRLVEAQEELRETALEPLRASDWPGTLVPRLTRVQGVIAAQAGDRALARRRLEEAEQGWRVQLSLLSRGERMASVLADLGRPVIGLIEPERELELVLGELQSLKETEGGGQHAVLS